MTHYLIDNQPNDWDELAKLYDKDGEYKKKYIESKMREQTKEATTNTAAAAAAPAAGEILENGPHEETKNQDKKLK